MKRIIILLVVCVLCLTGCSSPKDDGKTDNNENNNTNETVTVDENLIDVTITLPNDFFTTFDTTAEEYVAGLQDENHNFKNVVLNEDKSVSITMTKAEYKKMMSEMEEGMESSLQEIIDDENFTVKAIDHNKDFSEFNVTMSSNELGFADSFLVLSFAMLGGFYQMFDGNENPQVIVNFIGADGNVINTWNSTELEQ